MAIGPHKIEYEVIQGWEQMPEGWSFVEVAGVACDSHDRVYVFNRGKYPIIVFDKEGKFLNAWGEGMFKGPHGIFIDREDNLWLADDKDHTVHKFTPDGKKLMTLGESGKAADTGYKIGVSPVLRASGPFHRVTNVAVLPSGDMYIADGYGNHRVIVFDANSGAFKRMWGAFGKPPGGIDHCDIARVKEFPPGDGAADYNVVHAIRVAKDGLVYVADRENRRVQMFDSNGKFIKQLMKAISNSSLRLSSTGPTSINSTKSANRPSASQWKMPTPSIVPRKKQGGLRVGCAPSDAPDWAQMDMSQVQ